MVMPRSNSSARPKRPPMILSTRPHMVQKSKIAIGKFISYPPQNDRTKPRRALPQNKTRYYLITFLQKNKIFFAKKKVDAFISSDRR